jgi:hypothetical protein
MNQGGKGSSDMLKNYKDMKVWQKPYELCSEIYGITAKFPSEERYGLTSRIRRSVVSIQQDMEERQPWITFGCFTYPMVLFANWRHRYY